MSSESPPAAATAPDDRAELVDRLVAALSGRAPAGREQLLEQFARAYVRRAPAALTAELSEAALAAQVAGLFEFCDRRPPGQLAVRAYNPTGAEHGWHVPGSVVDVNVDDSPFLVDTVTGELHRHGLTPRLVVHPVIGTERGEDGRLAAVGSARAAAHRESVMHFEIDRRLAGDPLAALAADVSRVLTDLGQAVRDFVTMVERVEDMIEVARTASAGYSEEEIHETVEFLEWLTEDNFVFLGFREYEVLGSGAAAHVHVVEDSGLGILADASGSAFARPVRIGDLHEDLRERILGGPLLTISKTNRETTIHRSVRMDYVGVKRVGADGEVVGELRLLGLFTTKAYMEPVRRIPLVRRKLEQIVRWEDFFPGSHDFKAVTSLFESFPKDELFAASAENLHTVTMALLGMEEGRGVRLFVRPDIPRRSVSAIIALPRDHVSTDLRVRLQNLLEERFHGTSVDYLLSFGESDVARFHFTVHVQDGEEVPTVPRGELEAEVLEACRTWDDRLSDALVEAAGEADGHELARRYSGMFPEYYKSAAAIYQAAFDVLQFEQLGPLRPYTIALQNERDAAEPLTRLKLYKTGGKAPLWDLLPMLEQLGLTVVEEVPTRLRGDDGEGRYLHDFGVLGPDRTVLDLDSVGEAVAETVRAVWDRRAESDSLNRLVTHAGLTWDQVAVLRAYRAYRQVMGTHFTARYQNDAFVRNAALTRKLLALFDARFDTAQRADTERVEEMAAEIAADLDAVASLDDDRILRNYLGMIMATVRSNVHTRDGASSHISFKLRCADVPGIPKPVPMWEVFVYSPDMEGVHLRGGYVARGGIRWSDRLQDYRTEILGLMKAQMVKNSVIVPVGAKGGFILKRPPTERAELMEEERRQYITLMRGLLDLTDNMVGGRVVHPPGVRVLDGEDAYLVVAADKGTAHLSDTANAISEEYGFWLGDAFASGGSAGYDHKELGITAKGAWESVKRHFRELGRDVMSEPFTCVGIGDMSGDVFGNGMLLSPHTRLVAAFDHRHVFLDPDPDPAAGLAERRRLYELAGSSWDDYDRALISDGGGVWPRTAKSVSLSEQVRAALGTEAVQMAPNELIQAVLRAPVDLLWNGGIGTYVKASGESHGDVGDRANDAVRVDGSALRATVVGEGGNLGFTQRGRIEYALAGGQINTDAIDNSAGVDCSDHEVNLKILLGLAAEAGELDRPGRDALLNEVADHVVDHVLYDNYLQVQILSQESAVSAVRLEAYEDLMVELERRGLLERSLEFLPSSEEMAERERTRSGMTRPELCVLLAYSKRLLRDQVLDSTLPDDTYLDASMREYFPRPVVERFGRYLATHSLRREIIATVVTNDVVNSMGITFATRMAAETGASADEVARAFLVAREVTDARGHWDVVERLDGVVHEAAQAELMDGIDGMVEQIARWYLHHVPNLDLSTEVERGRAGFRELVDCLEAPHTAAWQAVRDMRRERLLGQEVPEPPARFGAVVPELVYAPDILAVARESGRPVSEVAHAFYAVGERLYMDAIERRVVALPAQTRWQRLAWATMADDLRLLRRVIAARVIENCGQMSVDDAVDAYLETHIDPYQRLANLMETFASAAPDDESVIMVLLHQIRQVVT